jgi:hypothetical protein
MIKVEYFDKTLYLPETDLAFEIIDNAHTGLSRGLCEVWVYWLFHKWVFGFESKEKADYFLKRYFKNVIE